MAVLKSHHKEFIVKELACYKRPQEVLKSFQDQFPGVDLTNKQLSYYNPDNSAGRELAKKWTNLYNEVRDQFNKGVIEQPLALKQKRIQELTDIYYKFKDAKNYVMAADILKQIQGEMEVLEDHGGGKGDTNYYTQIINNTIESLK